MWPFSQQNAPLAIQILCDHSFQQIYPLQNKFRNVIILPAKYIPYKTNFVMWPFSLPNTPLTNTFCNVIILPAKYTPYKTIS